MTVEVKRIDVDELFSGFRERLNEELARIEAKPQPRETRDENGARVVTVCADDGTKTRDGAG